MNMPFRAWLPEGALRGGAVERALCDIATGWSQHWFARQTLGSIDPPVPAPAGQLARTVGLDWRSHAEGLAIALSSEARLALAGAMLDTSFRPADLTPTDMWLLDGLAAACLDDLALRLAGTFGLEEDGGWDSGGQAPVVGDDASVFRLGSAAATPLIHIVVERHAAARLIRARLDRAPREPLRPLADALCAQQVRVSARLGACTISLGELAGLAPGDVVVLDRALDQPLELAVNGRANAVRCRAESKDGKLQLKIVKPLDG